MTPITLSQENMHETILHRIIDSQDRQSSAFHYLLNQQQENVMALTLPQPDLPVFNGDPTNYCDFIRAFENLIERKTNSWSSRLYYLVQYTSGQVQELMRSCLSMREEEGYREARRLLLERYGQAYKIASAFVERISNGPPIKAEDGLGLQRFSILLTSCSNTLKEIGYLSKLENPDGMRKIIDRLPFSLKAKWREVVDGIMQRERRDATVKDISDFIEARARVANHPIFGKISSDGRRNESSNPRKQPFSVKNYATFGEQIPPTTFSKNVKCPSCDKNHWLSQCDTFKRMKVDDRYKFVRAKGLCVNCLVPGHFVRDCPKKSFCRVDSCADKHSTFLHVKVSKTPSSISSSPKFEQKEHFSKSETKDANVGPTVNESKNGYVRTVSKPQRCSKGTSTTALAVIPVKVKAKGTSKIVETYAFLDSGSNTSFCTEHLLQQLSLEGTKTTLSLTTLENTNKHTETSFVDMEIFDLNEDHFAELPTVYSTALLPISQENIARQEDVDRWQHLKGIRVQEIDAGVGLLIGSNVPEVLQPIEVRESKDGGPFATRTKFGWVLNGPLGRQGNHQHTVNIIHTDTELNRQFEGFCNQEFNDSVYDSSTTMSQEDRRALKIMEETVRKNNGHYEIALSTVPPE